MLDLNLNFVHEHTATTTDFRTDLDESGTSNSSIVNAEGCSSSNIGDDDVVSVTGDEDSFRCFNFDILKNDENRTSQSQSQTQTRSEFVTRTLFPMSHEEQKVNSLLLFPNGNINNGDMRLVQHVQQSKPTVQQNQIGRKSRRGPRSRSSQYRGVTFYRRTGRWESHIWDCGKQVYLGGFDTAHAAARAYDRAAIKFRGVDADINFNVSDYEEDMNQVKNFSKEEFVQLLRRHSNGVSRGGSKYRGMMMMMNKNCGLWEAPMGQLLGKKAYDKEAIKSNAYVGETVASHYGNRHNLDLNLRVSTPSCLGNGSTMNENLEHNMQLSHNLHDIRRSIQAGNQSTTALNGLPLISEHSQSWSNSNTYPQIIGGSSHGPSNWAWQPLGQSQTPTAFFIAASSRFPAPAATNYLNHK